MALLVTGSLEGDSLTYSWPVESRRSEIQVNMTSELWALVPTGQSRGLGLGTVHLLTS